MYTRKSCSLWWLKMQRQVWISWFVSVRPVEYPSLLFTFHGNVTFCHYVLLVRMIALKETGKSQVILCGIEAHVCVLQTALDLIDMDYNVFLVCDAGKCNKAIYFFSLIYYIFTRKHCNWFIKVSSQKPHDRATALERMKSSGVTLTTSESILFDLMRSADHTNFKQISGLLKEANAQGNEFSSDSYN